MVECVRPEPGKRIADPACGTGGFFLGAYDFITNPDHFTLDREQKAFLKHDTFHGHEIVANTRRLCLMNLFLHNIGEIDGGVPISPNDSLVADDGERYDYVLANPPFGKKSALSFTNEEGEHQTDDLTYNRQDFWATTSNKQLNFVQHIRTMLKTSGRAAVVVPDNVLFEGGAGETSRRKSARQHRPAHHPAVADRRLLRARGQGQRDLLRQPGSEPASGTKRVWYYDYRTNVHHTLKKKPSCATSTWPTSSAFATTRKTGTSAVRRRGTRRMPRTALAQLPLRRSWRATPRPASTFSGSRTRA